MAVFKGARSNATVENDGSTVTVKMQAGHSKNATGTGRFNLEGGINASAKVQT
jgi:hypothetical protein